MRASCDVIVPSVKKPASHWCRVHFDFCLFVSQCICFLVANGAHHLCVHNDVLCPPSQSPPSVVSADPGPNFTHPRIHQSPDCLHRGGWHDMAGALTFKGWHHAFQGCPASGGCESRVGLLTVFICVSTVFVQQLLFVSHW